MGDPLRDIDDGACRDVVGIAEHDRYALVAAPAQRRAERNGCQQRNVIAVGAERPRHLGASALAEQVEQGPVGQGERRHVLDHADHPLTGLPGDEPAADRDVGRRRLRGGHHEHLGVRQDLADRDRDVSGARGHVDQQHVEVAEEHVGEELLHGAMQHRPAPRDHGFAVAQEHADRHGLHVVCDRRQHEVVDAGGLRAGRDAQQPRDREAVHIGIHQSDPEPLTGEGDGQIRGDGGLADAALPARDEDHPRQRVRSERHLPGGATLAQLLSERTPLVGGHDADVDGDLIDAGNGCRGIPDILLDVLGGGASDDREHDADPRDRAVDGDVAHHVEVADRAAQLGVGDGRDSRAHAVSERHGCSRLRCRR